MIYLFMILILIILWAINSLIIGANYGKLYGNENEWFRKIVTNSNNIFYCLFGIAGIAISAYWIDFIKWIVLAYFGISFAIGLIFLIVSVIIQIKIESVENLSEKDKWMILVSNIFPILGDAVIIIGCLNINFNLL